ncbi:unannotated protein [freshwater metagenome]|uniref:Unannotated protein n=1 Tax=freshwater metagenome TaxID=449393 RepID=A0A6J7KGB9_9ZZZZ
MLGAPLSAAYRHTSEINHVEQVCVGQFSRKVEADQIERRRRPMCVEREQRNISVAQKTFEIGPRGVGPLGYRVRILVKDFVENLQALIRQPDLIGVGVRQQPRHLVGSMVRGTSSVLEADVASRLRHLGQEGLQLGPNIVHEPLMLPGAPPTTGTGAYGRSRQGLERPRR